MTLGHLVMAMAAVALAVWTTWQHLGRTPASRSWASSVQGSLTRRSVLVVRPLLVVVLLSGAATGLVDSSTTTAVAVAVPAVAALVTLMAYLVLPLPIPAWAQPGWARTTTGRGSRG